MSSMPRNIANYKCCGFSGDDFSITFGRSMGRNESIDTAPATTADAHGDCAVDWLIIRTQGSVSIIGQMWKALRLMRGT